ncbi:KIAA0040 isoform 3 [Pongo abelii]|uniref:KIAA0040 isoform 3 n=1 Tax=Pongo abelii TaxID=9601 RepID=A0A2J8UBY8_PONAB|nr:KIAA0040 isoform 3 [Pongo abelii]
MHYVHVHRVTTQPRNKPQTKCPSGGQSQGPCGQFLDTVLAAMCPIAMLLTADPGMPPTYLWHTPHAKHKEHLSIHLSMVPKCVRMHITHTHKFRQQVRGQVYSAHQMVIGYILCAGKYIIYSHKNVLRESLARFRHIYNFITSKAPIHHLFHKPLREGER